MSLTEAWQQSASVKALLGLLTSLIAAGVVGTWSMVGEMAETRATLHQIGLRIDRIEGGFDERLRYLERHGARATTPGGKGETL
ncbi:MAG: hypothetical protein ACTS3R_07845 [Inquilinaceae bacterium]